jgi:hypothetical protein
VDTGLIVDIQDMAAERENQAGFLDRFKGLFSFPEEQRAERSS